MRKLSFLMALAVIFTTFATMFVVVPTAAADTPATPDSVTAISGYPLYTYANDEAAVADGAIGRFTTEGGNGYAKTWADVGANAKSCGSTMFWLLKDFNLDSNSRIKFDLGGSGRSLVIDGSLGQARTGEMAGKNFEIKTSERAFQYSGDASRANTAATLTWQNVTFSTDSHANSLMQSDHGLTMILGEGFVLNDPCTANNQWSIVVGATTKLIVNSGATINSNAGRGILPNGSGATVEINGGTINAARCIQTNAAGANITIKEGSILNCTEYYAMTLKHTGCTVIVEGGTFNLSSKSCYGAVMVENTGCTVTVKGGTVNFASGATQAARAAVCAIKTTTITVENVTVKGDGAVVSLVSSGTNYPDNSTATIKNATAPRAVYLDGGMGITVNVLGGTYTATTGNIVKWSNTRSSGRKDSVADNAVTAGNVNISGGTFITSDGARAFYIHQGLYGENKNFTVTGGTFIQNGNVEELYINASTNDEGVATSWNDPTAGYIVFTAGTNKINGGKFYIYSEATTLATTGSHFISFGGASTTIGDTAKFYGGANAGHIVVASTTLDATYGYCNITETIAKSVLDDGTGAPESVAASGTGYTLYQYASDAEAVADGAFGRFTLEGGNGYAKDWASVGAAATTCGADTLYIIKDMTLSGSSQRASFDLGGSGRKLTIDGSLGQRRTDENAGKNFTLTTNERLYHSDNKTRTSADVATLTWQNINLTSTSTSASMFQANSGITVIFGEGCVVDHSALSSAEAWSVVAGNYTKFIIKDGASFTSGGAVFLLNGAGNKAECVVEGGVVSGSYLAQTNGGGGVMTVTGGVTDATKAILNARHTDTTLDIQGGVITSITIAVNSNNKNSAGDYIYVSNAAPTITISGGNVTCSGTFVIDGKYDFSGSTIDGSLTISGGTINHKSTLTVSGSFEMSDGEFVGNTGGRAIDLYASTFTMTGGTITGKRPIQITKAGATMNISGGEITGTDIYILALKLATTLTISGGTIKSTSTSTNYGIVMIEGSGCEVNITGGNFDLSSASGKNNAVVCAYAADAIISLSGDVIADTDYAVVMHDGDTSTVANVVVNITGGNYKSAVKVGKGDNHTITISGGTFDGVAINMTSGVGHNVTITGGTFTSSSATLINWTATTKGSSVQSYMNIYGGSFNATGANRVINLSLSGDGPGKNLNIYGGTFSSNYTEALAWGNGTTTGGAIYISAGNVSIYSGKFYLYDGNGQLATAGYHINAWAGGNGTKVYGGSYNGGVMAVYNTSPVYTNSSLSGYSVNENACLGLGNYITETNKGASIRTALDDMGIRFQSYISADMVTLANKYKEAGEDVIFGTLIIPEDYLTKTNGIFTVDALGAAGLNYAEVAAVNGLIEDGNGGYTVRAALVDVMPANMTRKFTAIGFVKIGDVYVYANERSEGRSIDYVAKAALADVKTTADATYKTKVTNYYVSNGDGTFTFTEGTAYSKYNVAAITAIKECVVVG